MSQTISPEEEPLPAEWLTKMLALSKTIGDAIREAEARKAEHFGPKETWFPREGQAWRIKTYEGYMLILILKTTASYALFCPIMIEPSEEDERCLVSTPAYTLTPCPLIIWLGLKSIVKLSLLEDPFDDFGEKFIPLLREGRTPEGFRRGLPFASIFSEAAMAKAELEDKINFIAKMS